MIPRTGCVLVLRDIHADLLVYASWLRLKLGEQNCLLAFNTLRINNMQTVSSECAAEKCFGDVWREFQLASKHMARPVRKVVRAGPLWLCVASNAAALLQANCEMQIVPCEVFEKSLWTSSSKEAANGGDRSGQPEKRSSEKMCLRERAAQRRSGSEVSGGQRKISWGRFEKK